MANEQDELEDKRASVEKSSGNDAYKYILTFVVGLAAGVALGMYINSKQGKEVRKKVMRKMSALELEIEDKVNAAMEEVNRLAAKGGEVLKSKAENVTDNDQA